MSRQGIEEREHKRGPKSRRRRYGRGKELAVGWILVFFLLVLASGAAAAGFFLYFTWNDSRPVPAAGEESRPVLPETFPEGEPQEDNRPAGERAEELVSALSLEQKIAQMFFITPEQLTGYAVVTAAGKASREAYQKCPAGGLIYFKTNLEDPEQVKTMLGNMKKYSVEVVGAPVFLGVDEEGGTVARVGSQETFSVDRIPDMAVIGASGDGNQAYEAGKTIGSYLAPLGFNMDFAPVADVLTNRENKVLARRSFGSDPRLVTEFSGKFLQGLEEEGICGALKHFPGQGDVGADTHENAAVSNKTLEQLEKTELIPFRAGIEGGARVVLVSHMSLPAVTGGQTPACLSSKVVTELLRESLDFDGLVVTDALNMDAVADRYEPDMAAVMAIEAGVDMLLMPEDFQMAYQGVLSAVKEGRITEDRIDQSVRRIMKLKLELE